MNRTSADKGGEPRSDGVPAADLAAVWSSLPSPALTIAPEGYITAANAAAEDFLGMSERQLAGQSLTALAGEDSRLADLVRRVLRQGVKTAEYGVELDWPERPMRLVDLQAAPLVTADGGAVVLIHPRAILETMERSLGHRNAARSVAGMAQMLAHEIKNPLAGISGAAQLLEMSAEDEARELTRLIREEATRIGELIARVEQFGEIGPGRFRPVNIHDVLDRACRSAKAGFAAHARFTEDYDPSLPPTFGDPDQLLQLFLNLLKNAAEAVPETGGLISVRTAYRSGMKLATPSGRRESLPLEIVIADNGSGIPEDLRPHLFQPFVTTKARGTGLGLALVSKIVADHGGVISCDSEPGATRFRLLLPLASAAHGAREDAA